MSQKGTRGAASPAPSLAKIREWQAILSKSAQELAQELGIEPLEAARLQMATAREASAHVLERKGDGIVIEPDAA